MLRYEKVNGGSTQERVAVVAGCDIVFEEPALGLNQIELAYMITKKLLGATGLKPDDINLVIDSGSDFLDGRGISSCMTVDAMTANRKEESKVEQDGIFAAYYGFMRVAAGQYDTALMVSYGKPSFSSPFDQTNSIAEPFFSRPLGIDWLSMAALQASAYKKKYGVSDEAAAALAAKNKNGYLRRYGKHGSITARDVLESGVAMEPLREKEIAFPVDGACAILLASEKAAPSLCEKPAWIAGVGLASDCHYPGMRDMTSVLSAERAAAAAYRMAGIKDPRKEIDAVEAAADTVYQEMMLYEALGFSEKGGGSGMMNEKVNPSGGSLGANPYLSTGLVRLKEAP
ncbi:MAG: hypothetical protein FJ088_15110, partial [Deltaproteobacteria bacterium]|nr:hypothetical protein [Deltaproteobacteria bacterium]